MEADLQALQKRNVKIGVLQETNLTKGIHTHYRAFCKVWVAEAENRHRGGIIIIWREESGWHVEGAASFGPNVVKFYNHGRVETLVCS